MEIYLEPFVRQGYCRFSFPPQIATLDPELTIKEALQIVFPDARSQLKLFVPSNPPGKRMLAGKRKLKSLKIAPSTPLYPLHCRAPIRITLMNQQTTMVLLQMRLSVFALTQVIGEKLGFDAKQILDYSFQSTRGEWLIEEWTLLDNDPDIFSEQIFFLRKYFIDWPPRSNMWDIEDLFHQSMKDLKEMDLPEEEKYIFLRISEIKENENKGIAREDFKKKITEFIDLMPHFGVCNFNCKVYCKIEEKEIWEFQNSKIGISGKKKSNIFLKIENEKEKKFNFDELKNYYLWHSTFDFSEIQIFEKIKIFFYSIIFPKELEKIICFFLLKIWKKKEKNYLFFDFHEKGNYLLFFEENERRKVLNYADGYFMRLRRCSEIEAGNLPLL